MSSVHSTKTYHQCQCEACGTIFCIPGDGHKTQPEPYCPECAFEHSYWAAVAQGLVPDQREGRVA